MRDRLLAAGWSRCARRLAALLVLVAFGMLASAATLYADSERQMPLRGPQKLAAGPLLGFVSGAAATSTVRLTRVDPRTLQPSGSRSLQLGFPDAWAVAPGGRLLALAVHPDTTGHRNTLELVSLPSLRMPGAALALAADVSALAWSSPRRVVALVGRTTCCPARLSVVVADVNAGRILHQQRISGTALHIARSARALVVLTSPSGSIGPASLVVVDARGVHSTSLPPMRAGEIPSGAGTSKRRLPALAVDSAGNTAYVIDPDGSTATINLATLAVTHHHLTHQHSLLARLDTWLQPSANAKGDSGTVRHAQWLGNGLLLLAGSNMHDTRNGLASRPSGLELVDTRTWSAQTLDPNADSFAVTDGLLLATGARWYNNTSPTGIGLSAYAPGGKRAFTLLPGRDVWLDTGSSTNTHAYIGIYNHTRWALVNLRTGNITSTSNTPPILLLEPYWVPRRLGL
jgi:hypothetical protein